MSRRSFGLVAAAGVISLAGRRTATGQSLSDNPGLANLLGRDTEAFQASLDGTYSFLDAMMDAYAAASTVRLAQSYSDALFAPYSYVGFTYDNAVSIMAYLARGRNEDIRRATVLGKGLLQAQATNFPVSDGRFAQGYFVNLANSMGGFVTPAAFPFYFYTSSVGDQAWAGMALSQLYNVTGTQAFLDSAIKVAKWIVTNNYDTQGPGGFRFGATINSSNQSVPSTNGKATEHNIDCFAFFNMLNKVNKKGKVMGMSWSDLGQHALHFVEAMYNPTGGFFYTGTNGDQVTVSTGIIPEDVQTWSFLAFQSPSFGVSIDWVKTNLVTIDTPSCPFSALRALGNLRVEGETFDTASLATSGNDPEAVWLEGTAHTIAALLSRRLPAQDDIPFYSGDLQTALTLLENVRLAQAKLGVGQKVNGEPLTAGQGIVAATGNLDTGFGYDYFPDLHIGATGWYSIALQAANPFQLGLYTSKW